ncbi:hypothetical protein [Enterobacter sp. R1(2018)]|uniref:hypothetical protein n=1 Tax=Enterobacter sp. R1(2018) TaxID=2447891 RepID=UPI000EB31F66|nr:hypothetical protein [Enterobacter sp. R1(2018)]RKQ40159.1 hypothetical protein D8M09_08280 [Enterobacter sp. R1(2018)]
MKKLLLFGLLVSTFTAKAAYIEEAFICDSIDHLEELSTAWKNNDMVKIQSLVVSGNCDTNHERRDISGIINPGKGYVVFHFVDNNKSAVTLTQFLKDY